MRRLWFVSLLASLSACGDDARTIPVDVLWMDWPAEVEAGVPFRTRLVVFAPCAGIKAFRPSAHADPSAVTFRPYFIAENEEIICVQRGAVSEVLIVSALDTAGMAPGLSAESPRTYEMRATVPFYALAADFDVAPFGDVTVHPPSTVWEPTTIRNAGGRVVTQTDTFGCVRIRPAGLYAPGAALVLENPVDTAGLSGDFVRGYIRLVDPPVCGANRVFHLVSRN